MKRGRKPIGYKAPKPELVRVIVLTNDAQHDFKIPRFTAKALYDAGKLAWDLTNGHYCINEKTPAFIEGKVHYGQF